MIDMTKKYIIPSVLKYQKQLSDLALNKKSLMIDADLEMSMLNKISALNLKLYERLQTLEAAVVGAEDIVDSQKKADYYRDYICTGMQALREVSDELEPMISKECWKLPSYGDLLYSVN